MLLAVQLLNCHAVTSTTAMLGTYQIYKIEINKMRGHMQAYSCMYMLIMNEKKYLKIKILKFCHQKAYHTSLGNFIAKHMPTYQINFGNTLPRGILLGYHLGIQNWCILVKGEKVECCHDIYFDEADFPSLELPSSFDKLDNSPPPKSQVSPQSPQPEATTSTYNLSYGSDYFDLQDLIDIGSTNPPENPSDIGSTNPPENPTFPANFKYFPPKGIPQWLTQNKPTIPTSQSMCMRKTWFKKKWILQAILLH
ncbi:uncharacterized protein VP01_8584g1, partial [Puccinia sorghi]